MSYLLPRTRTFTVTGALQAHYSVFQSALALARIGLYSDLKLSAFHCEVNVNPGHNSDPSYPAGCALTVKALGTTTSFVFPLPNPGAVGSNGWFENQLGGTYMISGTLQDAFDYDDNTISLTLFETLSPGTVVTCVITFGGHTVTASATVLTSDIAPNLGINGNADILFVDNNPATGIAAGTEASITAGIVYSAGPAFSWGVANQLIVHSPIIPVRTWTMDTTNGVSVIMAASIYPGQGGAGAGLFHYPGSGYTISGKLFAGKYDYPEPLTVDIIQNLATDQYPASPTFSGSNSRGDGCQSSMVWHMSGDSAHPPIGGGQPLARDTILQASLRINTASLVAVGENGGVTQRLWGYWKKYDAFNLTSAATFSYDPFVSLTPANWTWAGLSGTVVTIAGGGMQIDATGSSTDPGTAKRTAALNNQQSWNGYRYIKIRVRSVGSASDKCTLSVYSTAQLGPRVIKRWDFRTGPDGAFIDIIIDLCSPGVYGLYTEPFGTPTESVLPFPSYDGKESNYPLYTVDSAYWGISLVDWLKVEIPQGKVIQITEITGQRVAGPTLDMMYGSAYFQAQQHSFANAHPSFRAITDGRVSLEASDNNTSGGLNVSRTIQEIIDQVNTIAPGPQQFWPGWSAVGSGPTDPFLNLSRPASFIGGAGAILESGVFTPYIDKPATGTVTVPAQVVFAAVSWYPECGDVLGLSGGAYGGNIILKAAAVLRAFAHGITYDYQGKILPSATVTVTRQDVAQAGGAGVSDSQGVYETGSPEGKYGKLYKIQPTLPAGNPPIVYLQSFQDQWMHRVVFRGGRVQQPIECDILSERVGYWLAFIDPSNGWLYADKYWHTDDPLLKSHVLIDDSGNAKEPRLAANHYGGTLSVTYRKDDDALRAYSFDYGDTWSVDGDPYKAAVSHVIEIYVRRDGWRLVFYYDPVDSFIKVDRYDPTNTYVDTINVSDPVVADDCSFGVWEPMDDTASCIQIAFLAAQIITALRSYDSGGTWVTIY